MQRSGHLIKLSAVKFFGQILLSNIFWCTGDRVRHGARQVGETLVGGLVSEDDYWLAIIKESYTVTIGTNTTNFPPHSLT